MRTILLSVITGAFAVGVHAQNKEGGPALTKPLIAAYTIYSGGLGDERAPAKDDRKIAFEVTGQAAKEMFDSLYPDVQGVSCSDVQGERLRRKGHVWCIYTPDGGYRCFFGFNLRNGNSIAVGSC